MSAAWDWRASPPACHSAKTLNLAHLSQREKDSRNEKDGALFLSRLVKWSMFTISASVFGNILTLSGLLSYPRKYS